MKLKRKSDRKEVLKKIRVLAVTALALLGVNLSVSQPAQAFMGYDYYMDPTNVSSNWLQQDALRRTFENHNKVFSSKGNSKKSTSKTTASKSGGSKTSTSKSSGGTKTATAKAKTTFKSDGNTRGMDAIVALYPSKQRAEVRKKYQQIYNSYPQVARSLGIPTNDMASGMASLLAGAYMAYTNTSLNDSYVKPLANQFRASMQEVDEFNRISDSDNKMIYDQMVLMGMVLAMTQVELQKQPDAKVKSQLRQAGKQVLEGVLKVNADRVRITASGLEIR